MAVYICDFSWLSLGPFCEEEKKIKLYVYVCAQFDKCLEKKRKKDIILFLNIRDN